MAFPQGLLDSLRRAPEGWAAQVAVQALGLGCFRWGRRSLPRMRNRCLVEA
ncbi:hypothetical protein ATK30_1564 [Amycolatopsis echigonensis]|uniref:Uncharacterized protein n=1 Tax=Amycolatopsis echigonensis TaxID=2576905 RepID=A0A2N3WAA9_9PSEU|nr:hypothetical protein ATK30_1564 [Amycolatopsis niigatensis]